MPTSSHGPIPSTSRPTCRPSPKKTSSGFKKLSKYDLSQKIDCDDDNVNFITNLQLVSEVVNGFAKCKFCDAEKCISMNLDSNYTNGLAHKMVLYCTNCQESTSSCTSSFVRKLPEVNTRFFHALRSIGCGIAAGKTFTAVMNLVPPNTKVQTYTKRLLNGITEACEASMRNAETEAVEENDGKNEIAAAFDGTWQKQGHTSMNGVVTVTSFDAEKVMDFECLSKFCVGCVNKSNRKFPEKKRQHSLKCSANYSGSSGGMEVVGAKRICSRSEEKLRVKLQNILVMETPRSLKLF